MRIDKKGNVSAIHWQDGKEYTFATVYLKKKGDGAGQFCLDIYDTFPILTADDIAVLAAHMRAKQEELSPHAVCQ